MNSYASHSGAGPPSTRDGAVNRASGGARRAQAPTAASVRCGQYHARMRSMKDSLRTAGTLRTCKPRQRSTFTRTHNQRDHTLYTVSGGNVMGELASIGRCVQVEVRRASVGGVRPRALARGYRLVRQLGRTRHLSSGTLSTHSPPSGVVPKERGRQVSAGCGREHWRGATV